MRLRKIIKVIVCFFFFFFLQKGEIAAQTTSFVTIVNPVRGDYAWGEKKGSPLLGLKYQADFIKKSGLSATWLLRDDAIGCCGIADYFKTDVGKNQELGIFLEVTPNLAREAEIGYPQGGVFWHDANKIFLSGYKPEEREKLIDATFRKFKETFGFFPKSVGAWHIDAFSADYMKKKYGVTGVLICADQFGTDGYQIWGGYWGVPFYPSKYNILMPAKTQKNKLDMVVFWWAARDPDLGYGGSVEESTFSVQVNDYQRHGLKIDYFKKLLDAYLNDIRNKFGQITIGLENDSNWEKIGLGFEDQINEIKRRNINQEVGVLTMKEFSQWYRKEFTISPKHWVREWVMSPEFRMGLIEKEGKKYIRDLRLYNEKWPEANLLTANPWGTLSINNPYKIDTVRFEDSATGIDFEINIKNLLKKFGSQKIPFKIKVFPLLLFYSSTLLLLIWCLKKNIPLLLLIFAGSVSLSLTMVKSGLIYSFGMGFWGPNGHDGIWHLALINQLSKFSFFHPTFSGEFLKNYHFGFDLLLAVLQRATGLLTVNLYFQIIPPILAVLMGILTFKFVEKWTASRTGAWWATFFVYFGGSWGWLVGFLRTGSLGGESTFWANQAISTLINPPFALSLIILLAGLIKFLDYLKKPDKKQLIVCSLLFGVLIQIKVYAGVIALGSLATLLLIFLTFYRVEIKVKEILVLFLVSLFVSLVIFLPFNIGFSSLLVFSPLWFSHTMLSFSDRLGWFKLENARQAYFQSGKWLKWVLAEGLAAVIFIFGNLGTRFIGLLAGLKSLKGKKISGIGVFMLLATVISLIFPLIFVQRGNPWNTIQFFYYFQFFMAIFAGVFMGKLWERRPKAVLFVSAVVVLFTLPTTALTLKNDYLPGRPPSKISIEELEALDYLEKQPAGVVLTYPFNPEWRYKFSEPKPLYAYETTAYVSAVSGKQNYLEDEMNLTISGYNWQPRREKSERFFLTNDIPWANKFLEENKIKYIYLVKGQKMNLGLGDINGKKIFENGETVIYRVN